MIIHLLYHRDTVHVLIFSSDHILNEILFFEDQDTIFAINF